MAAQPPDLPPREPSLADRDLSRRSRAGALNPVLIVAVIVLVGIVAFVVSAL